MVQHKEMKKLKDVKLNKADGVHAGGREHKTRGLCASIQLLHNVYI